MKIVPNRRIPKMWDTLPLGYTFYDKDIGILGVNKDGSAELSPGSEGDGWDYEEHQEFSQKRPVYGSYLKIIKVEGGFAVTAFNLSRSHIFETNAEKLETETIMPEWKLQPVVSYKEAWTKKKKPVAKRKEAA